MNDTISLPALTAQRLLDWRAKLKSCEDSKSALLLLLKRTPKCCQQPWIFPAALRGKTGCRIPRGRGLPDPRCLQNLRRLLSRNLHRHSRSMKPEYIIAYLICAYLSQALIHVIMEQWLCRIYKQESKLDAGGILLSMLGGILWPVIVPVAFFMFHLAERGKPRGSSCPPSGQNEPAQPDVVP